MMAMLAFTCVESVFAQESKNELERGIFNHVGINVSAGTEGIGVGVATPLTNFLELEAGVNFMPGFKLSGDLDCLPRPLRFQMEVILVRFRLQMPR